MGKRMAGQLTTSEMAVMITLGAIVAAPIQLPDRGLITGNYKTYTRLFLQALAHCFR